jgi:DNA-binding beta-propeller fold protein YncE
VAVVLGDALRRVSVLGGREGMPRSMGSVLGGCVTLFLGGIQGVASRVIATPGVRSDYSGLAVSRDGATLLVSNYGGSSHAIHEFSVADGSQLRVVGSKGRGLLQFDHPSQVWIAADGFVFVADCWNNRVQVLTPRLDFHGFFGVGSLDCPAGVCANADVVAVSENLRTRPPALVRSRISVFGRSGGAVLRRFSGPGLVSPYGLCFMSGDRHIAVADSRSDRVSVFSVDGEFIRDVGVGELSCPCAVVRPGDDSDALVVADAGKSRVVVFSAGGDVLKTMGDGQYTGVALLGGTVFAQDRAQQRCVVFT